MPSLFKIPVNQLWGIGKTKENAFNRLGIYTVGDLLEFYPKNYEDWSNPLCINDACIFSRSYHNTPCCIKADVRRVYEPHIVRNNMTIYKVEVKDEYNDRMTVTFFNQYYTYQKLVNGGEYLFYGVVKDSEYGYQMAPTHHMFLPCCGAGCRCHYPCRPRQIQNQQRNLRTVCRAPRILHLWRIMGRARQQDSQHTRLSNGCFQCPQRAQGSRTALARRLLRRRISLARRYRSALTTP